MIASVGPRQMPYPGLRPYTAEDAPLFFGREAQIGALLRQLEDHRFVAVVGSSGSGKSSLVRAGLLPAVREGFLLGTTDWFVLFMRPGQDPYQGLARALDEATGPHGEAPIALREEASATPGDAKALAALRSTDRGLLLALADTGIRADGKVMVVVDQFEELFAFRRTGARREDVISRDEAAGFVRLLLRSCSDSEGRVWVVLTMRSDFIGDCEAFLGLPEAVSQSQFLVPRLNRSQMEEAITRPGEVRDAAFQPFSFEEGLVNTIINDAGDRPDQLPLMQHALMRTWKLAVGRAGEDGAGFQLKHEDYGEAGGIDNALSRHADQAWEEIEGDPKKAPIARQLFLQLCDTSPDGQITRRRPQVAEVEAVTGAGIAEIREVVRAFQEDDRNFLLPAAGRLSSEDLLDISHEALLRQWRRFADDWQAQERDDASELRRLTELTSLHSRGAGGLLPAADLARITHWQDRVSPEWAQRYVKKETWEGALAFIQASRAAVQRETQQRNRQLRQKRVLFTTLGFVLAAATLVLAVFSYRAETAKAAAQEALTNSSLRTIGVFDSAYAIASDELAALWELAELDSANVKVRELVIDHWFKNEESVWRALNGTARGLRAATGMNAVLHAYSVSRNEELAGRLVAVLEDPEQTDADRLLWLGQQLAALAARMEPKEAASLAGRLVTVLEDPKQTDAGRLSTVVSTLAGLAARMEPKEAASLAGRLVTLLEDPEQTDADRLSSLAEPLAEMAAKIEPKEAASFAGRLVTVLEDSKQTGADLFLFAEPLVGLAAKMEPKEAASLAGRLVAVLEDPEQILVWLAVPLAGLAAKMEPKETASLAGRLVTVLEDPKETDTDRLSRLAEATAGLAAKMEPKEAAAVAGRGARRLAGLLEDPKQTDANHLWWLRRALAGLAAKLEPKEAASLAGRLVTVLEDSKQTGADRLSTVGQALAALAARMEPKEAVSLAGRLVTVLEDPKQTDAGRLSSLAEPLAGMAANMEPQEAVSLAGRLVTVLEEPERYRVPALGQALGTLSLTIPMARQTQLLALSNMLLHQVPSEGDEDARNVVIRLCELLAPQDLGEVLKWPFAVGEAESIVLASLEKKTGKAFQGDVWKFVEQAEGLGIQGIELPAKRPRVQDALKELDELRDGTAHR